MTIVYRPDAIHDLQRSCDYIKHNLGNPSAAAALRMKVLRSISLLKETPLMGMALRSKFENLETDIRFLIVNHQLIFYEINGQTIFILRILDGRTDYLTQLFH